MDALTAEFEGLIKEHDLKTKAGEDLIDDVLTYALFPQVGLNFIQNRGNPDAFEPAPTGKAEAPTTDTGDSIYTVEVEGKSYTVTVNNGGDITGLAALGGNNDSAGAGAATPETSVAKGGDPVAAPLAGNVIKTPLAVGAQVFPGICVDIV